MLPEKAQGHMIAKEEKNTDENEAQITGLEDVSETCETAKILNS